MMQRMLRCENQSPQNIDSYRRFTLIIQYRSDVEFPTTTLEPLSAGCVELIQSLLVADPSRRITMEQVKGHRWFLEALPEGAGSMNDLFIADSVSLSYEQV